MKIFISQPMRGLTEEEIKFNREKCICYLMYSIPSQFSVIDSFIREREKGAIWCLGESIKLMQNADLVVFLSGWKEARGCRIEHEVCKSYGINYIELWGTIC